MTGRIAVLRALPGVGDLLCAVPALRAVRAAHPGAEVTLIGLPGATWFIERFRPYVDRLLPLTAWPGLPEGITEGHYRFVNKNLIEMLACLVLASTPNGLWIGLEQIREQPKLSECPRALPLQSRDGQSRFRMRALEQRRTQSEHLVGDRAEKAGTPVGGALSVNTERSLCLA